MSTYFVFYHFSSISLPPCGRRYSKDSDGFSDPFAVIRYRGLESTSSTKMKTLSPEWGEVFTFRTPPGKDELDEEDQVELFIYDRDFALNDFIGYAKYDLSGTKVMTDAKPKHTREWKQLESMPKDQEADFFDLNHMKARGEGVAYICSFISLSSPHEKTRRCESHEKALGKRTSAPMPSLFTFVRKRLTRTFPRSRPFPARRRSSCSGKASGP